MAQLRDKAHLIFFVLVLFSCSTQYAETYPIETTAIDYPYIENVEFIISEDDESFSLVVNVFTQDNQQQLDKIFITFDMKFKESYESDKTGVCIGPVWDEAGAGDLSIFLFTQDEGLFTGTIDAAKSKVEDECANYFYYVRYLSLYLKDETQVLYGVATDYARNFPDAPEVWLKDKKNNTIIIGESNIEKYSLNFTLKESS